MDILTLKLIFPNYATKADIINISHVDNSSFALKTNLAILKTEVDKLDIKPTAVDLSACCCWLRLQKNDVVKKISY